MRFREWIKRSGLSDAEVGRRLSVSRGNINDLANDRFWPTRAVLLRIYELTDGDVTPNDFFKLPPRARAKKK